MNLTPLAAAQQYVASGLSVFPLQLNGSKKPAIAEWTPFRERQPTAEELHGWFSAGAAGIGLVGGFAGLFVIDIDHEAYTDAICRAIKLVWPDFATYVAIIDTPRPGRQLLCRTVSPPGCLKLANRRNDRGEIYAFIECKGTGGYVVAVGSPVEVHRNKTPYRQVGGCPIHELPLVDALHAEKLLAVARLFNEVSVETTAFHRDPYDGPPRPGDVFNRLADWQVLLTGAGWTLDHEDGECQYWRRPGKDVGHSAQLSFFKDEATGVPMLGVFSTAVSFGPRDGGKTVRLLSKFDFLSHAFHGGDYSQAALTAVEQFGPWIDEAQRDYQQQQATAAGEASVAVRLCDVEARDLEWLWPNFLLVGETNLYSGEQGLGKSFLVNDLAARITTGRPWPDGTANLHGPSSVLMLLAEDDPATVVKPRQLAAGGNTAFISILPPVIPAKDGNDQVISLRDDLAMIDRELTHFATNGCPPCRLIVIDPLSAFLGKTDGDNWADTRIVTTKLARFAQQHRIALLIVHHFGKDMSRAVIHRSLGSTTFTAAARVFMTGHRDRQDRDRRILYRAKSNVSPTGLAMAYRLGEPTGLFSQQIAVIWEPTPFEFDPRANDADSPMSRRDDRRKFLETWLEGLEFPVPVQTVYEQPRDFGFSDKLVRIVAHERGITSTNYGKFGGPYYFVRGEDSEANTSPPAQGNPLGSDVSPCTGKTSDPEPSTDSAHNGRPSRDAKNTGNFSGRTFSETSDPEPERWVV
jgi:putative DNA primase/helicase